MYFFVKRPQLNVIKVSVNNIPSNKAKVDEVSQLIQQFTFFLSYSLFAYHTKIILYEKS